MRTLQISALPAVLQHRQGPRVATLGPIGTPMLCAHPSSGSLGWCSFRRKRSHRCQWWVMKISELLDKPVTWAAPPIYKLTCWFCPLFGQRLLWSSSLDGDEAVPLSRPRQLPPLLTSSSLYWDPESSLRSLATKDEPWGKAGHSAYWTQACCLTCCWVLREPASGLPDW